MRLLQEESAESITTIIIVLFNFNHRYRPEGPTFMTGEFNLLLSCMVHYIIIAFWYGRP